MTVNDNNDNQKGNTMTTTEAKTIADKVLATIKDDIKTFTDKLSVPVLDGTPMLLVMTEADAVSTFRRVYGDWDGVKGWKADQLVPAHLCGAMMFSPENAKRNVAKLMAAGLNVQAVHWRTFAEQRVAALTELANKLGAI